MPKVKSKQLSSVRRDSSRRRDADHVYFRSHFPELVKDHGGEWIVIAEGKLVGVGKKQSIGRLLSKARQAYPKSTPFIAPIPSQDDIQCVL